MSQEQLFTLGKPCFYTIEADVSAFQDLTMQLTCTYKESVTRIIRGNKSKTVQSFFDECAASLQFPYYFGENWSAFDECITDLDWLEGDAYLLMINNASALLCEASPEDFGTLLRIFAKANDEWLTPNTYIPRNQNPTPFHVVFQCAAEDILPFTQRLTSFNVLFAQLEGIFEVTPSESTR
jgi:hypothetical protein